MRVAVLILAYRYPLGLKALSDYFSSHPDFRLYVHVDQKVDIKPFVENSDQSIYFLEDRVNVFWRGWTMVEATMKLIYEARSQDDFDRYLLISDDSLPLVNLQTLTQSLEDSADYFHLDVNVERVWRYDKFFMFDSEGTQLRYSPSREFTDLAMSRLERMIALRRRGKRPIAQHFQGSQWWGLSASSIEIIIESWEVDLWLRESFEFSDAPDEGYFHQILGENETIQSRSLMCVDWNADHPPRVFTCSAEFRGINKQNFLFIRKIDFTNEELGQYLEKIRCSHSSATALPL
jgi:hypothetical protein